jgi:hypothetical protein
MMVRIEQLPQLEIDHAALQSPARGRENVVRRPGPVHLLVHMVERRGCCLKLFYDTRRRTVDRASFHAAARYRDTKKSPPAHARVSAPEQSYARFAAPHPRRGT